MPVVLVALVLGRAFNNMMSGRGSFGRARLFRIRQVVASDFRDGHAAANSDRPDAPAGGQTGLYLLLGMEPLRGIPRTGPIEIRGGKDLAFAKVEVTHPGKGNLGADSFLVVLHQFDGDNRWFELLGDQR